MIWLLVLISLLVIFNIYSSKKLFEDSKKLNQIILVPDVEDEEFVEEKFPLDLHKIYSEVNNESVYVWLTDDCRGCIDTLNELKNRITEREFLENKLKILYHGEIENVKSNEINFSIYDLRNDISKEALGSILKYSPIFFKVNQFKDIHEVSSTVERYFERR